MIRLKPRSETIFDGFQNDVSNDTFINSKYVFKYDLNNSGSKRTWLSDDDGILAEIARHPVNNWYELVRHGKVVRMYFDIDHACDRTLTPDQQQERTTDIVKELMRTAGRLAAVDLDPRETIVLTAHRPGKISIHVIFTGALFACNSLQRVFSGRVAAALKEDDADFEIDTSVYSRNRAFRCAGMTKFDQDRPLVFHPWFMRTDFKGSLVQVHAFMRGVQAKMVSVVDGDDVVLDRVLVHRHNTVSFSDIPGADAAVAAFLKDHPEFVAGARAGDIMRLDRVQGVRTKCVTTDDTHSSENAFITCGAKGLFAHCFCAPKKSKLICAITRPAAAASAPGSEQATRTDRIEIAPKYQPIPIEGITYTTNEPKGRMNAAAYAALVAKCFTLFDTRNTGSGKTHSAMAYARAHFNPSEVAVVHHRQSLDVDYCEAYGLTSYKSVGDNGPAEDVTFSICVNSLHKFVNIHSKKLVIFDEIRSILQQLTMKSIDVRSVQAFLNLIEFFPGRIICMDANMSNADIEYVVGIRNRSRQQPAPHQVIAQPVGTPTKNARVYVSPPSDVQYDAIRLIKKYYDRGTKMVMPHGCAIHTKWRAINAAIEAQCKDIKIINIHRETRETLDLSIDHLLEYDIIQYSPTISEGVSFADPRFADHVCVGLFNSMSNSAETSSQMAARFRNVTEFDLFVGAAEKKPRFTTVAEYEKHVNANIGALNRIMNRVSRYDETIGRRTLEVIRDDFFDLAAKAEVELEADKCNYVKTLGQRLTNNGFAVTEFRADGPDEFERLWWQANMDGARTQYGDELKNAPLIVDPEVVDRLARGKQTIDTGLQVTKYFIHKTTRVATESDDLDYAYWQDLNARQRLSNLRALIQFDRSVERAWDGTTTGEYARVPTTQVIKQLAISAHDKIADADTFAGQRVHATSIKAVQARRMLALVKQLGFSELPDTKRLDLAQFTSALTALHGNYTHKAFVRDTTAMNRRGGMDVYHKITRTLENFLHYINALLSAFGISVNATKTHAFMQHMFDTEVYLASPTEPSILGDEAIPSDVRDEWSTFFTGSAPVLCEACSKQVSARQIFRHNRTKTHLKNAERKADRERKKQRPKQQAPPTQKRKRVSYTCDICDHAPFTNKTKYERHTRRCGKEKVSYTCACGETFHHKGDFRKHVASCTDTKSTKRLLG